MICSEYMSDILEYSLQHWYGSNTWGGGHPLLKPCDVSIRIHQGDL